MTTQEMENQMEEVLTSLGFGEEVKRTFKDEKIFVSTVNLLTNEQLKELGIKTVGQQVILKEACKRLTSC
jgi:hypothetical protein